MLDEGSAHEAVDEQNGRFSNVVADQPPYDPYSVRGLALSTGISKIRGEHGAEALLC